MKKLLIGLVVSLLFVSNCFAGLVSRYNTYATTGEVNSANLNGNFDNILTELNGGLDNTNIDISTYRLNEILGSLPSAGTQGRTVFLTTDSTLNFDTGSTWVKPLTATGTAVQGDILYYSGTAWSRLGYGTSGYFLKTQGAAADPTWAVANSYSDTRFKVGALTRVMNAVTGDVAYTGVGFVPTSILFMGNSDNVAIVTFGFSNITSGGSVYSTDNVSWNISTASASIVLTEPTGKSQGAIAKSFDADGFTLTWTKTGEPTAGTANVIFMAFR